MNTLLLSLLLVPQVNNTYLVEAPEIKIQAEHTIEKRMSMIEVSESFKNIINVEKSILDKYKNSAIEFLNTLNLTNEDKETFILNINNAKNEKEIELLKNNSKNLSEYKTAKEKKAQEIITTKLYSLSEFMFKGVIYYNNYKWTFYSQQVLPGGGLKIPGRHVNSDGYVADKDGYIVLAAPSSWGDKFGAIYDTPFGYKGKVYDVNAGGTALDVYIR